MAWFVLFLVLCVPAAFVGDAALEALTRRNGRSAADDF